jgi:hypothetical protein
MPRSRVALLVPLIVAASTPLGAQGSADLTFTLGAGHFGLSNPIWRKPSGHEEVALDQSSSAAGPRAGVLLTAGRIGVGAELFLFNSSFSRFSIPRYEGLGDTTTTLYDNPRYALSNVDLTVHWFPAPHTLSIYGLLGMAMRKESFRISGAFAEWDNGAKSYSEFTYGYGVGARLAVLGRLALSADYRWMPGDRSTSCNDVGKLIKDYGTYGLYECDTDIESYTKNHSKLASVGVQLMLGGRRGRPASSRSP